MAAQHLYRDGNQWGVTVQELLQNAIDEGRPLRLRWRKDGTWVSPRDYPTSLIPIITDEMLADSSWFADRGKQS